MNLERTSPARVLIVDDERLNRDLLSIMLESEGCLVQTSASGEEALALTTETQPDLILLDVMMPGLDGYQVVARLKADARTKHIPVVMVTALNDREARVRGLSAGAEDFLSKPVDRIELQVRVRNLLRLKAFSDLHRQRGDKLGVEVTSRTAELAESERRYREMVETTSDGILKVDLAGTILFANRRFGEMLGYGVEELVGQSAFRLLNPSTEAASRAALIRRGQGVVETYETIFRHKGGAELTVSLAGTPTRNAAGVVVGSQASVRDVTEQKKLIAQMTVSDRMASIGTLAAGVAHELNNPLACVMGNLELVTREVTRKSEQFGLQAEFAEIQEELRDVGEAAERIRSIVRDLRIFSRSEEDKTGAVDLRKIIESTLRMAWNEIRHRARLVRNLGDVPSVQASEARLGQVFLNLIVNAAQAIEEGRAETNEIRISTSLDRSGGVAIEISDTGAGIPADVLARLFTPFFTTKPVGVGTGLGLSICHRIITGFGGSIDVQSTVGKGTTFRLVLPRAHSAATEAVPPASSGAVVARRRGRVLMVDDEPLIARAVQRTLSSEHDVVAVTSADLALERIKAGERFDVILCDLMMPDKTGMDLHAELSRTDQTLADRMIFLTGGAFTSRARAFMDQTPNKRLDKPFDTAKLRALINDSVV